MFLILTKHSDIITKAKNAKFKPHFILHIISFLLIFFFSPSIALIFNSILNFLFNDILLNNNIMLFDMYIIIALFKTGITTLVCILFCKLIEKRNLHSMGFVKAKAFSSYFKGLLVGFCMITSCVLIAYITGAIRLNGLSNYSPNLLMLFFIGFIIQGMMEEVLLRGYFMVSIACRYSILFAIIINSTLFSLLHIFNNGINIWGIINLVLFSIFASIYMLKSNNIWGISAIHSIWNFAQGNIFGLPVSGINMNTSIISFYSDNKKVILNGGDFGLEGGIIVTLVLAISILIMIKNHKNYHNNLTIIK